MYFVALASSVLDLAETKSKDHAGLKDANSSLYESRFMSKIQQAAFLLFQSKPFSVAIQKLEV